VAAIRQGRYVLNWLANGATFVVNILAEGERGLIRHFGKGFEEGASAFDGLEVNQGVLAQAHASLECRVAAMHDVGDHVLVVGQVAGGAVISDGKPAVHVRKTGRHY
jgi:flavin reductase (DIM6/NTAB) family NADH-FMN oxidoreductase RutF